MQCLEKENEITDTALAEWRQLKLKGQQARPWGNQKQTVEVPST